MGRRKDKYQLLITLSIMVLWLSLGIPHHLRTAVSQGYFVFVSFLKPKGNVEAENLAEAAKLLQTVIHSTGQSTKYTDC